MGKMHTKAERTEKVEEIKAETRTKVKEIIILPSSGVSTLYAAQGGIILVG